MYRIKLSERIQRTQFNIFLNKVYDFKLGNSDIVQLGDSFGTVLVYKDEVEIV